MFRLLLLQVSQSARPVASSVVRCSVVCRVSFSGAKKALVEGSKEGRRERRRRQEGSVGL